MTIRYKPAALPPILEDKRAVIAVINSNFAVQAGLDNNTDVF